jgi:hypothetical protein
MKKEKGNVKGEEAEVETEENLFMGYITTLSVAHVQVSTDSMIERQ